MADRTFSYEFRGKFDNLRAGLTTAGRNVDEFGKKLTALDKDGARMRAGMTQLADTAGKASLALTAGLVAATKAAMDWESQFAGVRKTVNGSAAEIDAIEESLREMARTMPATHEEIAATAEAAGQLGVATQDIASFTEVMIQLGETTNLTADEAATSLAQFMNVMESTGDSVDEIGATIVALGNNGASTEADIVNMAQRVAGAGKLIGASESDVLALSSAMANLGIQSELGGGAMQRVLIEMNTAVMDGGKQAQQFAEVAGMSAEDFAASWRGDPIEALDAFLQGLGGIQDSGGNVVSVLSQLGIKGTQNLQVMLRLAGAGDQLTDALGLSAEAWDENTALINEYAQRAGTTESQVTVAWNNIKDAGIDAGETLLPIVADLADGVSSVAQAFGDLPKPVQDALVGLAGITALVGGAAWFGARTINAVVSTRQAIVDLGGSSTKTTKAMKGLAGAGAGLAVFGAASAGIRAIQEATDEALPGINALTMQLLKLNDGQVSSLSSEYDSLGESIRRITDKGANEAFSDFMMTPFEGSFVKSSSLRQAEAEVDSLDAALAGLVTSGHADVAADSLSKLADAQGLSEAQTEALIGILPQYQEALDGAANSAALAEDDTATYTSQLQQAQDAASSSAREIRNLIDAMLEQRDTARSAFDAETRWRQALKDATAAAKENSAGIKGNSDKVLENRSALSELADAWNSQDKAVRNNVERYKEARKSFIDTAEAMGVPRKQAQGLADDLLAIPRQRLIKIDAEAAAAQAALDATQAKLDNLKDKTVTVRVTTSGTNASTPGFGPVPVSADGSTVPKDGKPYGDRYLYMLAPGEEVISNRRGQADRHRPLLKAINNAADGATVGGLRGGLESRGDQLRLIQSIRQIQRSLEKTGDDQLKGLERLIAKNDLAQARRDLMLARIAPALDKATARLDSTTARLSDVRQNASALSGTVSGSLASELFSSSGWGGGDLATLRGDIATGRGMKQDIATLRRKGLRGDALQAVLADGAATTERYAGMSRRQIGQYGRLYDRRERVLSSVGSAAGSAVYGPEAKQLRQEVRGLRREVKQLKSATVTSSRDNAERVVQGVNGAAAAGMRRAMKGRTR
ncbi:phage tail tape measure protein [Nocardioides bruguierae]|uniref:Phage tail tape measure protein n=1 Tax=Nocardioides bruguierae TaxID=2945102 RepID=A0A9X2D404_9ACTN|nr:phage tail tape measure protein [Nocardioides bruguierae]MCM0618751.1 phage tail tape measure protein [Nocardioides bruguierae]